MKTDRTEFRQHLQAASVALVNSGQRPHRSDCGHCVSRRGHANTRSDSRRSSRRIVAAGMKRVTSADSPDALESAFERSMFLDRLNEVAAAGWLETALLPEYRAEENLIQSHYADQHSTRHFDKHFPETGDPHWHEGLMTVPQPKGNVESRNASCIRRFFANLSNGKASTVRHGQRCSRRSAKKADLESSCLNV